MTKETNNNDTQAAIRAAFERLMLSSAEDAGIDNGPSFTRSTECPESYADNHVQATWFGYSERAKSGESNKLELTIISLANRHLQEMEYHLKNPKVQGGFVDSFQNLMAVVEVAHLADSGLSEGTTRMLIDIEQQAVKLFAHNEKTQSAILFVLLLFITVSSIMMSGFYFLEKNEKTTDESTPSNDLAGQGDDENADGGNNNTEFLTTSKLGSKHK